MIPTTSDQPPTSPGPATAAESRASTVVGVVALALLIASSGVYQTPAPPIPATASSVMLRIDPTIATESELALLPGIGPQRAAAIIAFREAAGDRPAFRCADDLARVHGIGPITTERLKPHLCFPITREP